MLLSKYLFTTFRVVLLIDSEWKMTVYTLFGFVFSVISCLATNCGVIEYMFISYWFDEDIVIAICMGHFGP